MKSALLEARALIDQVMADDKLLRAGQSAADVLVAALRSGNKIMLCGNGGSSCDAAHFAEELTGRFKSDRRPLAALACTDFGHITCTANDYGYDFVFSRWVEALAKKGDAVVFLSTSGKSINIVNAVNAAKQAGATTIALLGKSGGHLRDACEHELIFPGKTSDRIQELHMLMLHIWCQEIEDKAV
ncbi:D-sedoheptulose 7-phosphate isomerase [soil metagenome]